MNTRSRKPSSDLAGVFKFTYPQNEDSNSNPARKRQLTSTNASRPTKSSRQKQDSVGMFTSPQPVNGQRERRDPSSASTASSRVPASPAFNQPCLSFFKQSTPLHSKTADRSGISNERKRGSPMKNASMYKTPEKKKRIYSSDEEELEFSPSGRRMSCAERRTLLQNATQWSTRVDQEERFHGVYVRSVERLKRRLLSESMQSVETSTTCSETSESSLDMSSYEVDETVLTRRQKQIAYGKNTTEYECYARHVDKMSRTRNDPGTPDKFDRVSRRRFDGRIRTWRIQIHRWYETNVKPTDENNVKPVVVDESNVKPVVVDESNVKPVVVDENTVTVQAGNNEGTMTEAPVTSKSLRSPAVKAISRFCGGGPNIPGMEDESAVDAFQSPKKAATGRSTEVHTELTCDLAGFAICGNSQSTLTGHPGSNSNSGTSYQTRSRARLVFS